MSRSPRGVLAPKPVHPTPMRFHGLLGLPYVRQHMQVDERWSPNALIDEFCGMTSLLGKRLIFKRLESKAYRKQLYKSIRRLRTQCRIGRAKLQNVMTGNNISAIRNFLINHKDMQRLYQKMNIHQVVDNINQRTFVMRKERDRLTHRLDILKKEYENVQKKRANIENRIKYQDEFVLDEEVQSFKFMKDIENSNVRLRANKTINATYRKIIQVLRYDAIFYEPIIRSLCHDIDDQAGFVKHILALGSPAISKFRQLSEEYRVLDEKSRRALQIRIQMINAHKLARNSKPTGLKTPKEPEPQPNFSKRYTRETASMLKLKSQLEEIEVVIKKIKMETLCSKSTEIFPRIKSQVENNIRLVKKNEIGTIRNEFLIFKNKVAAEQESVLLHNYFDDEESRLKYIISLQKAIAAQDKLEEKIIEYMKNHANSFVVLRYTLWNLYGILKNVPGTLPPHTVQYPNAYLKLPLLKFEMLGSATLAPEPYDNNARNVLALIEKKVRLLMTRYAEAVSSNKRIQEKKMTVHDVLDEFHRKFMESKSTEEVNEGIEEKDLVERTEDVFEDVKVLNSVPNRKQIKSQSAKIVEERSKKDEQ